MTDRKLAVVAVAGAAAASGAVWLAAHQPPNRLTEPDPALELLVGALLLGCGLWSWRARPENRIGRIMVFTAFAWFAEMLIDARPPLLNTIGLAVQSWWILGLVYLLLAFPSGRLAGRIDRWLIGIGAVGISLQVLAMLDGNKAGLRCPGCSDNLLQITHANQKAINLLALEHMIGAVVVVAVIVLLVRRWLQGSGAQRRAVAPVLVAGCATLVTLEWTVVFDLLGDPLQATPASVFRYTFASVPLAVVYVFLQRQLARGSVAGLVVQLGQPSAPTGLRDAVARALGDQSLELGFWLPEGRRYVDGEGRTVAVPQSGSGRRATFVQRAGEPAAVLIHDPVLDHNEELVRSVCAVATLALENERLQAALRARLLDLQASRARLVQATDDERRRIERDLHDGTQQRLVSIAMSLGLLESRLPVTADGALPLAPLVREAREELTVALAELRELTHGINPPLLVERGLPAALDELCGRAALPVVLQVDFDRRLPERVESAAYFLVSEALANAAKHSHGRNVQVLTSCGSASLTMHVSDDGIGGAAAAGGSGLRGLADRVEALGGSLTISSPPGRGTTLQAEIPCA
ncbi:MAG: sensor histidine kinase [Solirubrobacteraceae bacterium]